MVDTGMPITVYERQSGDRNISIAILLLCAGRSSRMGDGMPHKLLSEFGGLPLARRSAV
jgi:molybdenum cofactor cytidylyltransferase